MKTKKVAPGGAGTPAALVRRMTRGWAGVGRKSAGGAEGAWVRRHAAVFRERQRALGERFAGQTLVIPSGHEQVRSNDTHFRFRPGSDVVYLTGCQEPDAVLVLVPRQGRGHRVLLFLRENPGRKTAEFFTDRTRGELWVGPYPTLAEARALWPVDEVLPLAAFTAALSAWPQPRLRRGLSPALDGHRRFARSQRRDAALAEALSEQRLCKDALEIQSLEASIAMTRRGLEDVLRVVAPGVSERRIEGVFALRAREEGNDVGYDTIAAAGDHACILHWTRNDGVLRDGELLLLDAGVEGPHLYTADMTRTVPVSGRFSPVQRTLYALVHEAQRAAIAEVKPGADFLAPHRKASEVLAHGLERLGVLASAREALREDRQYYKRYTLHGTSHMLGLDVHDCAHARPTAYRQGKLQPGMVLTVEPGLYFQSNDTTVPKRFRGIGIRIEDDILVTERGARNLSASIPSEAEAVEAWMRDVRGT